MKCKRRQKIILVPYPAQGHVTPMLKLASSFQNHGFESIFITPNHIHRKISSQAQSKPSITFVAMPDNDDNGAPQDFFSIESAIEHSFPAHLEKLVSCLDADRDQTGGVFCMVVDLLVSSAVEVGQRCGVPVAGFWPAMLATYKLISAIPDMLRKGLISDTGCPQEGGLMCCLPNQPMISTEELPWLIGNLPARKARFKFWKRTLARSRSLQWLLLNSFSQEPILQKPKTLDRDPFIFPIGAMMKQATIQNPSLWEEDESCLEWLDRQNPNSVLYISFGSWVTTIGEAAVRNLAMAIESSKRPFIWVLKASWREGLPLGFPDRVSGRGKVVSWAPQMEILKHGSVGCYLTHCGWNSTMEAIQCRKRLLCYPVAGDQFMNCIYIVKVWKIGVLLKGFGEREVEDGLRMVMEDREVSKRIAQLHERTMGEEATQQAKHNLKAFIDEIKQTKAREKEKTSINHSQRTDISSDFTI